MVGPRGMCGKRAEAKAVGSVGSGGNCSVSGEDWSGKGWSEVSGDGSEFSGEDWLFSGADWALSGEDENEGEEGDWEEEGVGDGYWGLSKMWRNW